VRINWKRFAFVFLLLQVACFTVACSAAWLASLSSMLPILETLVTAAISFVAALSGSTVSPAITAAIKKIGDDVAAEIKNVQDLVAVYQANASTGTLSQIEAVMQSIVASLGNILAAFQVTDPTTVSKLTQLVALAIAAAQAIVALIPLVAAKLTSGEPVKQLESDDKLAAGTLNNFVKGMKSTYVQIVTEKTGNAPVDKALASLPQSL
jgi:hypothetical protein